MIFNNCFICGSETLCSHREMELVVWFKSLEARWPEENNVRNAIGKAQPVAVKEKQCLLN